jgi:predicted CXXCH cytochrome family protein
VAEGECTACHLSHAGKLDGLLPEPPGRLCVSCHGDIGEKIEAPAAHVPAAEGGCLDCHQAHESELETLLASSVPGQCLDCHDGESDDFRRLHLGLEGSQIDCRKCHDAHGAPLEGLMLQVQHGPFEDRSCAACHVEAESAGEGE